MNEEHGKVEWRGGSEMHNGATSTPMILQGIDHVLESNGKPFMKLKDQKVDQWHSLFWKNKLKWANTFFRTAQSRGTRSHPFQQKLRHNLHFLKLLLVPMLICICKTFTFPRVNLHLQSFYLSPCWERKSAQAPGWGEIPTAPPAGEQLCSI